MINNKLQVATCNLQPVTCNLKPATCNPLLMFPDTHIK